jgi:hypothetical protein
MGREAGSSEAASVSCQVVPNVEGALLRDEGAITPGKVYDSSAIIDCEK